MSFLCMYLQKSITFNVRYTHGIRHTNLFVQCAQCYRKFSTCALPKRILVRIAIASTNNLRSPHHELISMSMNSTFYRRIYWVANWNGHDTRIQSMRVSVCLEMKDWVKVRAKKSIVYVSPSNLRIKHEYFFFDFSISKFRRCKNSKTPIICLVNSSDIQTIVHTFSWGSSHTNGVIRIIKLSNVFFGFFVFRKWLAWMFHASEESETEKQPKMDPIVIHFNHVI